MARASHGRRQSWAAGASSSCSWMPAAMAEPLLGVPASSACRKSTHLTAPAGTLQAGFCSQTQPWCLCSFPLTVLPSQALPTQPCIQASQGPGGCEGLPDHPVTPRCPCVPADCASCLFLWKGCKAGVKIERHLLNKAETPLVWEGA